MAARSLSQVASDTLTTLAAYWLALWALTGAVDLVIDTGVEMAPVRQPLMIIWLLAAAALLGARFLPRRARTPALLTTTFALAAASVVGRELSGLVAPWLPITIVAGMALTAVGFLASYRLLPLAAVLVVGLVLAPQRVDEMARENSPVQLGVPIMEALLVLGLGLLAALIRAVMLSSADRGDRQMERAWKQRRAALGERARADALSNQMSLLHDTALNTLHAIALAPARDPQAQRRRCRQDAQRLRAIDTIPSAYSSLASRLRRLSSSAAAEGLTLTVDVRPDASSLAKLPPPVTEAVCGALDEAVLNVVKHAQVDRAHLSIVGDASHVRASLRDEGLGFDSRAQRSGFGIDESILNRLDAVGGSARVDSRPGAGTSVQLEWRRGSGQEPVHDTVSQTVTRLMVLLLSTCTLFMAGLVVAEWGAFERPELALLGALALGAWGLAVTALLRRRGPITTSIGVVTVALACVAPFWTTASDQYCASSFSGIGWVDPRVPLIVMVMVTSAYWWRAIPAVPVFIAVVFMAGRVWDEAFVGCGGGNAITAASASLTIFVASLMAGRTLNRQASNIARAQQQRDDAEAQRVRAEALRSERQRWFSYALGSCVPLLESIGDGRADPADEQVRRRCQQESGLLRGLIAAAQAPAELRDGLREAMQKAHKTGLDIGVRGDFAALPTLPHDVNDFVGASLPELQAGQTLTVTAIAEGDAGSVMVLVTASDGGGLAPVGTAHPQPPTGLEVVVDDSDGFWMELSWTADGERAPAESLSPARSSRTRERSAASR